MKSVGVMMIAIEVMVSALEVIVTAVDHDDSFRSPGYS